MRFVKCLALSAVVFGILSVHVQAAVPVTSPQKRVMPVPDGPTVTADPAAMAAQCPAVPQGTLSAAGGSWSGDTTGLTNDFEDDYPTGTGSYGSGGADEIHTFQVDTSGVWAFDTSMACWDTSLGLRVDTAGCPGDAVTFDGDSQSDCYYESLLSVFLVTGTDYYMVVDGWTTGTEGPYNVNYIMTLAACTDDAACSDGDPCNGDETCNVGNGQCEAGPPPCDRAQTCTPNPLRAGVTCTDPDGCLIYQNTGIAGWSSLGGGTEGTLIADDWGFATGALGRTLDNYTTVTVGVAGPYIVASTIWPHGKGCVGGSFERDECDVDGDCTGFLCVGGLNDGVACAVTNPDCPGLCDDGTTPCFADGDCTAPDLCSDPGDCPADGLCVDEGFFPPVGRQRPGRAEIPGTLCVFANIPSGYYVSLTCTPGSGAVMPTDGAWQVMGFVNTGGAAGPALAGQTPEIGTSTDVFGWDQGSNGTQWARFWFGGGNLANWSGELCTEALGACCDPGMGGTCSITTEASCAGSYIGDNNAVSEFDCGADVDADGVADVCDACPGNAEFAADEGPCQCSSADADTDDPGDNSCLDCNDACPNNADFCADTGPCNCDSTDTDGDGTLDCVDACPSNPDFAADQGPCNCSSADADGDGTLDCMDGCPDDPNKIDPGVCGCGVDDLADADGDGVPDCIDQCNGVDDAVFAPECVGAIPTVSEWGLVILALLLLAAGKVYFGRKTATA